MFSKKLTDKPHCCDKIWIMKSVGCFLAITLLTSGLPEANAETAALGRVRSRDSAANGDEGIRFTCDRRQMREIKAGMAAYLKSLDIPDWADARPEGAAMSGEDYRKVWHQLSGEII